MAFNEKLPKWDNVGIEPPEIKKTEGWQPTEKPPAQWFNWIFNRIYKVVQELQNKAVEKETGKGLSTNDYTTIEKNKLADIEDKANKTVIANNLTETVVGKALDATQGKTLNDSLVAHKADNTTIKHKAKTIGLDDVGGNFTIKNVEGAMNELFINVSNGKQLVAAAITDKGVPTASSNTFTEMSANINAITTEAIPSPGEGFSISTTDTNRFTKSTNPVKLKEIRVLKTGVYRIFFNLNSGNPGTQVNARLYRNGVAYGITRTTTLVIPGVIFKEDLSLNENDTIEVWGWCPTGAFNSIIKTFGLSVEVPVYGTVTLD